MHNESNYTFHLVIQNLAAKFEDSDFKCLTEKYRKVQSFTVVLDKTERK